MRYLTLIGLAAVALVFSGCAKSVSKSSIEKQIQSSLGARGYAAQVKSVSCPDNLDAKVGKTETCTVNTTNGKQLRVNATVRTVNGDKANLNYQVVK